ncbi:glycosyltransferase family 9 protein, partial [Bordetella pertussis]|uniref:glycosyltransferase family 9 protein n=1 Tax=Bordetella pertussis TaxID=520 RepID=UPI0038798D70
RARRAGRAAGPAADAGASRRGRAIAAGVAEARRNAPSATLLPPLGLGAFAALAQRAALVVCNDSGVSHVAAAVDARQLTLFGVTRPGRTGPWSPRAVCLGSETRWPGPEQVMEKSLELLSGA